MGNSLVELKKIYEILILIHGSMAFVVSSDDADEVYTTVYASF
jgi:hypothetical protein